MHPATNGFHALGGPFCSRSDATQCILQKVGLEIFNLLFFIQNNELQTLNLQRYKLHTKTRQNTLGRQRRVSYAVSIINFIIISGGEGVHAGVKEGGEEVHSSQFNEV